MRPLEILLVVLLAAILLAPFFTRRVNFLPPLALAVNILHLWLEGYRWQMIPLYGLTAALALANFSSLFKPDSAIERPRGWRAVASFLTLGLVAASAALPALLPVPRIATPTGEFQVGTAASRAVDLSQRPPQVLAEFFPSLRRRFLTKPAPTADDPPPGCSGSRIRSTVSPGCFAVRTGPKWRCCDSAGADEMVELRQLYADR